ncbi:Threonine--tRNA ligase [Candidatus Tiddalikarchaeum anstoanum]|nr:Threonine--tRNA ligase [Candidatus Tiddalikarchaeum anstoanum]
MKILTIHSDYIKFQPLKKAIQSPEEVDMAEHMMKECLVVFSAVEKPDEDNIEGVAERLVEEIIDVADQVKTKKVVIYPYAHLSSNLAKPAAAMEVLKKAEQLLKEKDYDVLRAPFGWYKKFEISCKGHPLSELSREFNGESKHPTGEKVRKEESEFSRYLIISPSGDVEEVTEKTWDKAKIWKDKTQRVDMLKSFVRNNLSGNIPKGEPKHVELMRKLELYDYVPESDVGNLRSYPNGALIFDLFKDYVLYNCALKLGCMKLYNPLMFDGEQPIIHDLVKDFHEKDYRVLSEKKEFILRYASDPLNFPLFSKLNITYKQMPFAIYEEAPSFRLEKRGECVGLKRLRAFNMLDVHVFTKTEEEATQKIEELCYNFSDMLKNVIGDKWVLGWEIVEKFWNKYKEYFVRISKKMNCPTFIKLMPEMSHYYAFKNEYQAIGLDGANVQVSTLQLDVKDGERFDISYIDKDGKKNPCYIIHTAPVGSLERCMYLVLENSVYDEAAGKCPMLPLWLAPEQVRVIPVIQNHFEAAVKLSEELEKHGIRVGVDDREESLGKKVFDAKSKWVPYVIVVGDKEVASKKYNVVIRSESDLKKDAKKDMTDKEIIDHIKERTKGLPFRPMYVNKFVSKRIVFVAWSQKKE